MSNSIDTEDISGYSSDRGRRVRSSNFSVHERNVLIHIIEKYQEVVECKKVDKASIEEKEKTWHCIEKEFNEVILSGPERTARQLKMCYENLKKKLRKGNSSGEEKAEKEKLNLGLIVSDLLPVSLSNNVDSSSNWQDLDQVPDCKSSCEEIYNDDYSNAAGSSEPFKKRRKEPTIAELRHTLLRKQISLADLDIEMRSRKYEMELKVEEAKLAYYQKKIALLDDQIQDEF